MRALSLNGSDWMLTCFWQHQWRMRGANDKPLRPALPPVPATVPGAVHADLLRAGLIADWQDGLNAQQCEWVNNRDWSLKRRVDVPADFDRQLTLECDGLDYSGHVLINAEPIATFEGTHLRHRFDLTGRVRPGEPFELELIFDVSPNLDGVYGFTSRTRLFKPRFAYYWDWCTRLVNVGIWQDLRLASRGGVRFDDCRVLPRVGDDLETGSVRVAGRIVGGPARLRYALHDDAGTVVKEGESALAPPALDVTVPVGPVRLWWPATHTGETPVPQGGPPLYRLTLELLDEAGRVSDRLERTIGFKQVRWLPNPGGPEGARPYLCEVNGQPIFMRGANWVPLSPLYGTVTPERYEAFLRLYRSMNANVLRVWGGGILETPAFYDACDRLGLLVWQEFPLSSSGIDNWPPEDPEVIEQLKRIAAEDIGRRCHHASHLLWCGGNELQGALDGGKVGIGRPVDESHPLMQAWAPLVEALDPGKRFLTASPTGPRFYAARDDFGKGIHHQTHGPWENVPLADRYAYFNGDDSLLRSETGAPGCASLASLERHRGNQPLWPPRESNPHWLVPAAHWLPWGDVAREFGPIPDDPAQLSSVVKASRYLQAESYRYLAEATRRRHPQCSGLLIWLGHDCVHCTANNSVIEIDAATKPAYDWLQRAWARRHVSMKHDSIHYAPEERLAAEVWVHRDRVPSGTAARPESSGSLAITLRGLNGTTLESVAAPAEAGESLRAAEIDWKLPAFAEGLFIVQIDLDESDAVASNRYLLSQQAEHPLAPLLSLPIAELEATLISDGRVEIRNTGGAAAVAVRLVADTSGVALLADRNNLILLPGEAEIVRFETIPACPDAPTPRLAVECFNQTARAGVRAAPTT